MANSLLRWSPSSAAFGFLRTMACGCIGVGLGRGIVTGTFQEEVTLRPSAMPSKSSPWLMISSQLGKNNKNTNTPPENMFYKFYSVAENRVININNNEATASTGPDADAFVLGSSHGWLAFINRRDCAVILSNPVQERNIKLPSIQTLLDTNESDIEPSCYDVERVILSSPSPDAKDCRVLIIYGFSCASKLAFCSPGCGDQAWTCLDSPLRNYTHIAYSSKNKKFFCVNQKFEFESWDLQEPLFPKRFPIEGLKIDGERHPNDDFDSETDISMTEEEYIFRAEAFCRPYIVENLSSSGKLYWIDRYVAVSVKEDGSVNRLIEDLDSRFPYKTLIFDVYELDLAKNVMTYKKDLLDDLAFFVGLNQSFVLHAKEFPELKPNSIYFTDDYTPYYYFEGSPSGGHDIGIYNYKDKSFGRCYYPCDFKNIFKIEPYPVWYIPNTL